MDPKERTCLAEIAETWASLVEAAETDPKAAAFLLMFAPFAKGALATLPKH